VSLPDSWHSHGVKRKPHKHTARTLTTPRALALGVTSLLCGVWISISTHDWSWFARSGSLLVVIGMWLTSCQIIENSRRLKQRRACHENNFHRDFADSVRHHPAHSLDDEDIWANGLHGLYLLVTGTLIWGFGDLAGVAISAMLS
jgi:hypothetical protein